MSVETANEELATASKNRGPFEVHYDDLKRRLAPKGIILTKLMTCIPGTDDYTAYMAAFTDPENTTIEVCVGDDKKTTTFYTVQYPAPVIAETAPANPTIEGATNDR